MAGECSVYIEIAGEHSGDVRWQLNGGGPRMTANALLEAVPPIRVSGMGQRK